MEQNEESLRVYDQLIEKDFSKANKEILKAEKENEYIDGSSQPKQLLEYYFQKANLLLNLYIKSSDEKFKVSFLENAERCKNLNYNYKESDELIKKLNSSDQKKELNRFSNHWDFFLGYVSWQDKLLLQGPAGNIDLIATTRGQTLGSGFRRQNTYWGHQHSLTYIYAQSNVGENSSLVDYFQKDVPVGALDFRSGLFAPVMDGQGQFGIDGIVLFRSGDYKSPNGYTLKNQNQLGYGIGIHARWYLGRYLFANKLSKISSTKSMMWEFDLGYSF
ncbi:MAG: hypothetical protein ACOYL6_05515 [Bacteriovoracaceae bacterium]